MRVVVCLVLLVLAGCADDGPSEEVALAEARARTAEAEARAAEARAAEAAAQADPAPAAAPTPAADPAPPAPEPLAPDQTPLVQDEPVVDYLPFDRPQRAVVETQSDGRITLRDAPQASAPRVVRVVDGTALEVLGCQAEPRVRTDAVAAGTPGRWCYARVGEHHGWAFDAYLRF